MAERFVESKPDHRWVYLATAQASDDEMRSRIAAHEERRADRWQIVEEPLNICSALNAICRDDSVVLLDCLTLWLSNIMLAGRDMSAETQALYDAISSVSGHLVCVSNEVGFSIVPETSLGRRFQDAQGKLNQHIAAVSDRVVFVLAGLSVVLKGR